MTELGEIMDALATQIEGFYGGTAPVMERLQVDGRLIANPTFPAVDVYPDSEFMESFTFGITNVVMFFTVRARVSTADHEAGQDLLLSMMDPANEASMREAIFYDRTLNGKVQRIASIEGPSGFLRDPGGDNNIIMSVWRVKVIP